MLLVGSRVQLPLNNYNALNLRKVLSEITSRMFIHGGFDLTVILYSIQIKQRRKKNTESKEGTIQIEFFFHPTLGVC